MVTAQFKSILVLCRKFAFSANQFRFSLNQSADPIRYAIETVQPERTCYAFRTISTNGFRCESKPESYININIASIIVRRTLSSITHFAATAAAAAVLHAPASISFVCDCDKAFPGVRANPAAAADAAA